MKLLKFYQRSGFIYINPETIRFIKPDDEDGYTYLDLGPQGWAVVEGDMDSVIAKLKVHNCAEIIEFYG